MCPYSQVEAAMEHSETRYDDHFDLARLPYFELREGRRLAIADPSLGPTIDLHTHLALAYGPPMRVDLNRAHDRTSHYLSLERPIDLDVYMNRNFSPADLRRLKRDLVLKSFTARGMRATHTLPNLAREMGELGIAHSVLLPIDLPVLSRNAETYLEAVAGRDDVLSFGSVHPYSTGVAERLDRQKALGARGVKFHPNVQMCRPDNGRAIRLFRLCGERGLPVLMHCGPVGIEPKSGRRRSQVRLYEKPIAECPETTFVLGHSGALQMELALDLAKRYPNAWLELSSQSIGNLRRILDEAPHDRIAFGTDWPFYHQAPQLAKILILTEDDEPLRRAALYDNAARLLGLPPARKPRNDSPTNE